MRRLKVNIEDSTNRLAELEQRQENLLCYYNQINACQSLVDAEA